ncbi:MAG: aldehyde ferredoxin oxidoreductase family protein [Theionarchaea archaeon]|nr:aldehyde ferredoxin oxidoreductase family protein [Theionarchaea archaeon]MBU7034073.1 aldehyde ferredoxin oxidoreductase family protein [Theionarchaea archaeon]MBU7041445.1 aldehyde ferredoxin oxidoreductase family protein [Theionarchaea archaeon]
MMHGWAGKILRINLTKGKITEQETPKELRALVIGGRGINTKILYDEVPPNLDPLDPRAKMIVGAGPFVGTLVPTACRGTITHKGPFTFAFCDSNFGGFFTPEMKYAGYDHIIVEGKSEQPVYLWIDDGHVELRKATSLWGLDTLTAFREIEEEIGDREVHTMVIGPAGENLVRTSCVMVDYWRAAGWAGTGALMGSKNLKAITVRGTHSLTAAQPKRFEAACKKARQMMINGPRTPLYKRYGRLSNIESLRHRGGDGVENYRIPDMPEEGFQTFNSENIRQTIYTHREGCFNCPIGCGHSFKVKVNGKHIHASKIEYAPAGDVKALGIYNPEFLATWVYEVNKWGLDTTGTQNVIAFAMECYENGLITDKDTDGVELTFGNEEATLAILHKIVFRQGIGDVLAEGTNLAAKKIGKGAEKYAMTIKGARLHLDPRIGWGLMLAHAVASRGADHLKGTPWIEFWDFAAIKDENLGQKLFGHPKAVDAATPEGKEYTVKWYQESKGIIDSLGFCAGQDSSTSFEYPGHNEMAEMFSALTGHEYSAEDLKLVGERIYNLEQAYNVRCGLRRKDDSIPERFFDKSTPTSQNAKIKTVDRATFEKMKDNYYTLRGWDLETAIPTEKKLKELGLNDVARDLKELAHE